MQKKNKVKMAFLPFGDPSRLPSGRKLVNKEKHNTEGEMPNITKRYVISGCTTDVNKDKKPKYIIMGSAFEFDDGKIKLKIDSIPVSFNGWAYLNVKKDSSSKDVVEQESDLKEDAPF